MFHLKTIEQSLADVSEENRIFPINVILCTSSPSSFSKVVREDTSIQGPFFRFFFRSYGIFGRKPCSSCSSPCTSDEKHYRHLSRRQSSPHKISPSFRRLFQPHSFITMDSTDREDCSRTPGVTAKRKQSPCYHEDPMSSSTTHQIPPGASHSTRIPREEVVFVEVHDKSIPRKPPPTSVTASPARSSLRKSSLYASPNVVIHPQKFLLEGGLQDKNLQGLLSRLQLMETIEHALALTEDTSRLLTEDGMLLGDDNSEDSSTTEHGLSSELDGGAWEFSLRRDPPFY